MCGKLQCRPRRDLIAAEKGLVVRLRNVYVAIQRGTNGDFDALMRDTRCIQPAIGSAHLRRGDRELAESGSHFEGSCRHPLEWVKVPNLTDNPTVLGQFRSIEQRGCTDAGLSSQSRRPELIDTGANWRDDPEPRDDGLPLHRLVLSTIAVGRVSPGNPNI